MLEEEPGESGSSWPRDPGRTYDRAARTCGGRGSLKPDVPRGRAIGLLAATGAERVRSASATSVAILSNGDEISPISEFQRVMAGETIPETNGPTLLPPFEALEGSPFHWALQGITRRASWKRSIWPSPEQADVLVTSGGASMGEHDLFKRVFEGLGFSLDFSRVKMRPGTPFPSAPCPAENGVPSLPVFGLPGDPASSLVTFQVFLSALSPEIGRSPENSPPCGMVGPAEFRSP